MMRLAHKVLICSMVVLAVTAMLVAHSLIRDRLDEPVIYRMEPSDRENDQAWYRWPLDKFVLRPGMSGKLTMDAWVEYYQYGELQGNAYETVDEQEIEHKYKALPLWVANEKFSFPWEIHLNIKLGGTSEFPNTPSTILQWKSQRDFPGELLMFNEQQPLQMDVVYPLRMWFNHDSGDYDRSTDMFQNIVDTAAEVYVLKVRFRLE